MGQGKALLQLTAAGIPGERFDPQFDQAAEQGVPQHSSRRLGPGTPLEHQRPQPQLSLGPDALLLVIPAHLGALLARSLGEAEQAAGGKRQGQLDAGIAAAAIGGGDRQGWSTHQGIARMQYGSAPAAGEVAAGAGRALQRYPLWVGMGQQFGGQHRFGFSWVALNRAGRELAAQLLLQLLKLLTPWIAARASQPIEPLHQIAASLLLREGIALAQQRRQAATQRLGSQVAGAQ